MRCRGCRGMGEAAPTGWLGVGRPVSPPVPGRHKRGHLPPIGGQVSRLKYQFGDRPRHKKKVA